MDNIMPAEKFIKHFGVKGMRWGVRRGGSSGSKKGSKKSKVSSEEADQITKIKRKSDSKNRRRLSDQSLKKKIERLENEKKLRDLIERDTSPGKALMKRVVAQSGEKVLKTFAEGAMKYGVKAALEKSFDLKDAAKYIAPKPKSK